HHLSRLRRPEGTQGTALSEVLRPKAVRHRLRGRQGSQIDLPRLRRHEETRPGTSLPRVRGAPSHRPSHARRAGERRVALRLAPTNVFEIRRDTATLVGVAAKVIALLLVALAVALASEA